MVKKSRKLALVVGNDIYPEPFQSLSKATTDASRVAGFLEQRLEFDVTQLHNESASTVVSALLKIVKQLTDDSQFFFYFAGHGLCVGASSKQSLLCADASELLLDGVVSASGAISPDALAAISRQGRGDMFFCLDVCRTQTLRQRGGSEVQRGGDGLRDAAARPNGKRGTVQGRRLILSSCADSEGAFDDGSFASALVSEMKQALDGGYELELGYDLVLRVTKRLKHGQTPQLDGTPFVLFPGRKVKSQHRDEGEELERFRQKIAELEQNRPKNAKEGRSSAFAFFVKRDVFVSAFARMSNFVSNRDLRPVLQNVKLDVNNDGIVLSATNGGSSAREDIQANDFLKIEGSGSALLDARKLKKIFSETLEQLGEVLLFEVVDNSLLIKDERFSHRFDHVSDDIDIFPTIPRFQETSYFKLPVGSFERMTRRTLFATTPNNAHYELDGVRFIFERDKATAVATDGFRLALQESKAEYVSAERDEEFHAKEALISRYALDLIEQSHFAPTDAAFSFTEDAAHIQLGNVSIVAPLLTYGRFPDWKSVIPDTSSLNPVEFIAGDLERAARLAEERAKSRRKRERDAAFIEISENRFSISSRFGSSNLGVDFPVKYDGESISIKLDIHCILDFIQTVSPDETMYFYVVCGDYRTLFKTTDDYLYCLMRVQE